MEAEKSRLEDQFLKMNSNLEQYEIQTAGFMSAIERNRSLEAELWASQSLVASLEDRVADYEKRQHHQAAEEAALTDLIGRLGEFAERVIEAPPATGFGRSVQKSELRGLVSEVNPKVRSYRRIVDETLNTIFGRRSFTKM